MSGFDLVITNARVVTCDGPEEGSPEARLGMIDGGALAVEGDRIAWIGPEKPFRTRMGSRPT